MFHRPTVKSLKWKPVDTDSRILKVACTRISVFMSVFNVHVNRVPHEGTIRQVTIFPGKFFSANLDKASKPKMNTTPCSSKALPENRSAFVQIAGLIARRIICAVQPGDVQSNGDSDSV